jgi:murein DD-endopeptidase MepM/ murein hydrolase activator NlpD
MVEIDHGNGLVSRYAHASRLMVKEGDLVVRGQRIAAVGSTGRSTGPHLHFEVRLNGTPQNPARFFKQSG